MQRKKSLNTDVVIQSGMNVNLVPGYVEGHFFSFVTFRQYGPE